jgi:DnaJ-class molecular chaperone
MNRDWEYDVQVVAFPLTKGERATIQEGLDKLAYGFARDIHAKLEATRCTACGGNGYAPYVGGDDDDDPCTTCKGSGFKSALPEQEVV